MKLWITGALLALLPAAATNSAEFPLYEPAVCGERAQDRGPKLKVRLPSGIDLVVHRFYWDTATNTMHIVGADPVKIFCNSF